MYNLINKLLNKSIHLRPHSICNIHVHILLLYTNIGNRYKYSYTYIIRHYGDIDKRYTFSSNLISKFNKILGIIKVLLA